MAVAEAVSGVDAVVHLAARAGIDDSVRDPLGTFEANVAWSVGLLEAARLAGVKRFVFASSNAAAGDHEPPSDETDLPHPVSPVRRLQARDRGVRRGLCRDVRADRLLAALLERLRAELAAQAERGGGLAPGGDRR